MILDPYRPFNPRQCPLYYGWVILFCVTCGMMTAIPGSPPGISPFLEPMTAVYGINRSSFTFAYMIGTILAGIITWKASSLFDQWDARFLATLTFFLLGISLIFTGLGHRVYFLMTKESEPSPSLAVFLLTASFFFIRFLGLGVMMTLTRSMIVRWFVRYRSLAISLNGIVLSLSFASAPALVFILVDAVGWQWSWIYMGIFFSLVMTLFSFLFFRHSPEQVGLTPPQDPIPRGEAPSPGQATQGERRFPVYRDFTAREATRTSTFWIVVCGISFNGLVGTGIVVNLVAFGTDQGLSEREALLLLLPSALFNIIITLTLGAIGHKTDMKWVLLTLLIGVMLKVTGATMLDTLVGKVAFAFGGGIAWGCFGILLGLPWPRYFGTRYIGSINACVTAFVILASAIGPFLFGWVRDASGSFNPAIQSCLLALPLLFIACLFLKNPQCAFKPTEHPNG